MTRYIQENKATAQLAELLALEHGVEPVLARQIRVAAALHDVGKMQIPADILQKPGRLDAREYEIMKTHTTLGAAMLSCIQGTLGEIARLSAQYHHEHWDGNGYFGIRSGELPEYIQIISLCDVYSALIHPRSYKRAWPQKDALAYITNRAGTQFNPSLVDTFLSLIQNNTRVPAVLSGQGAFS